MVMIYYKDNRFGFIELFNDETGTLIRSNILDNGIETGQLPPMRSFPELIDIGIMGACDAGKTGLCRNAGVDCYQRGISSCEKNMDFDDYSAIINQCKGRVFQIALGGAGDPNKHEFFPDILHITRENRIVPNYTTSGYALTDKEIELTKKYCGAVAVSYYSKLDKYGNEDNPSTISALERFVKAGCITNVHYVLSKKSIKEAIYRVKNGVFPKGINAVVFLLYKPIGLASRKHVIDCGDPDYLELLRLVASADSSWRYGFDTCQSPAIYKFASYSQKDFSVGRIQKGMEEIINELFKEKRRRTSALPCYCSSVLVPGTGCPGDRRTCVRHPHRHGADTDPDKKGAISPRRELYIEKNPELKGLRLSMLSYEDQGLMENKPLYAVNFAF